MMAGDGGDGRTCRGLSAWPETAETVGEGFGMAGAVKDGQKRQDRREKAGMWPGMAGDERKWPEKAGADGPDGVRDGQ